MSNLVPICVGPLSRNVEGLVRFMHATCVPLHFELDCRVTPLAFDEAVCKIITLCV